MSEIEFTIKPLQGYIKYASADYTLCTIDIDVRGDGAAHHFKSECNDRCLRKLMSSISDFLSGEVKAGAELYFYIPWIAGHRTMYPYSFKISEDGNSWSFRYKRNRKHRDVDFVCDLSRDNLIALRDSLAAQYARIDWDYLGKANLFTFVFPDEEYQWCYSARVLCESLNQLCKGKKILKIYVSAANYAHPSRISENYLNYDLGSQVILQLEAAVVDLLIYAYGLFAWRYFKAPEYAAHGPTLKHIQDGRSEFCDIGDAYGLFKAEYADVPIEHVAIMATDDWAWTARGFDESKLGEPVELPQEIVFYLSSNRALSFRGLDDDFAIELMESTYDRYT